MNLDKILNLVIAFGLIISLIMIAAITHDLNNLWQALSENASLIAASAENLKNLQILVLQQLGKIGTMVGL